MIVAGDQLLAYKNAPAAMASMAKLRARASMHSTTRSSRRKKRTSAIPGQTKRNHNIMNGRTAVSVITNDTSPAAMVERMMIAGHNHRNRFTIYSLLYYRFKVHIPIFVHRDYYTPV